MMLDPSDDAEARPADRASRRASGSGEPLRGATPAAGPDFSQRGPFDVGAIETRIVSRADPLDPARALPVEIWYPARNAATASRAPSSGPDPDAPDAPHPLGMPHAARRGLRPAEHDTPRPLIAFSHGNSGLRQQSTFLTTHLASWGFVVVAPDHVGNTWSEMLALEDEAARRALHRRIRRQRPQDMAAVLGALLDEGQEASRLPALDPQRVGALGHSFGGWTILKLPRLDPRVRALCGLAPASEPFIGRRAFEPGELPLAAGIEALILAAEDDVLVDLETSIRPLHARLGPDVRLEVIERTDHFHFCDGIAALHNMHVNTPRPNLPRAPRPLAELLGERETQTRLCERVTRFFQAAWADSCDRRGETR